ncbi:putative Curculin-like (Mannose-binding) lectin protein [Thiomonas sp. CB3]|nr:putative Curculin-like (Mannose-binding) lectin protein [Thiomonas sp. CB3]
MPILSTDIKLLDSQRMTDTSDGGGRMTSTEIPDNVAGNLFPKISRLDAVYGRVNLRKIFMQVRTASLDVYGGANMVIVDPPDNAKVSVLLFSTGSDFDTRNEARDRIEGYVIKGVKSRMKLFGDQIVGQKAILVYQKTSEPLPEIGEVYLLSVEKVGYTAAEQYVRITDLKYEDRSFTVAVSSGEQTFTRRVITLGIGYPLVQTFPGAEVTYVEDTGSPTVVRETNVADTARYFGIQPFNSAVLAGAFTVQAASLFAPIVPSTNRETAVSMAQVGGAIQYAVASDPITINGMAFSSTPQWFVRELSSYVWTSASNGNIPVILKYGDSVTLRDSQIVTLDVGPKFSNKNDAAPGVFSGAAYAAQVQHPPHTRAIPITLATQGTVYSEVCNPIPAPGSLIVDYRALGRWYRLQDDGIGQLSDGSGTTTVGSGSISYVDGALVLTLGALPDVGSSLLLSWASPAHYERLSVSTPAILPPKLTGTLAATAIDNAVVPGSFTATWGAGLTVTDDSHGNLTGSGTGTINYLTRQYTLTPTALPAPNTVVQWSYQTVAPNALSPSIVTGTVNGKVMSISALGGGNLKPGSVQITVSVSAGGGIARNVLFADDGNGNLVGSAGGTINYTTGDCALTIADSRAYTWGGYTTDGVGYVMANWTLTTYPATFASATATCRFSISTDATTAQLDSSTITALSIDLTPYTANTVVPGSLLFSTAGRQYYDKTGTLYDQFDPATGSGFAAGTIDYAQGLATLTEWVAGATTALTLQAGLTKFGDFWVYESSFRTPGSPLRPASLYIQISSADGRLLTGTADQNGLITGPEMSGQVQQDMGVVDVRYGLLVLDSSLTAEQKSEPWYNPADVDGTGHIWMPTKCMPETLRFSCVVLAQLPLDPTLLGLDPVRLPKDGRVPIYRPGDVVVLLNTKDDAAATLTAAQTIVLTRNDIAVLSILDANGKRLDPALYTADLAAGSVTMASPLDLSAYVAPFLIRHRREEMNLVGGTQIDGTLELSSPTVYDHDATSYVASALLFGDMQAAYTGLFDQLVWTGVWSDTLIGSAANATYDDLNHPIEVLNDGCVTERWRIDFTSSTAFNVTGEHLGIIATGTTAADVSVVNSLTGKPYFVLRFAGWGLGWAAGNQLRFNTTGAAAPVWLARTILAGATVAGDSFSIERRGDIG